MSYHAAKKKQVAEHVLKERENERRLAAARVAASLQRSNEWLAEYRMKPRPTRFDWRPKLNPDYRHNPFQPPEETKHVKASEEIIEGEFTEIVADAAPGSEAGGGVRPAVASEGAAQGSLAAPQGAVEDFETPF